VTSPSQRILHQTSGFIAVDKPAGVTVIPGRESTRAESLVGLLETELGRKLWVVHRLDRDTSGVVLFALGAPTHRTLSMAFEAGEVEKVYLALVQGVIEGPLDLEMPLVPARRGRMRPAREGESGKPARTRVVPIERLGAEATLVEARPLTGRTHQIRVHLASAGHPLLVDHQYGGRHKRGQAPLVTRTPLHAARLVLRGLAGIEDVVIEAPLPLDMAQALERLRT
jgi:RluA family pseudouridine synthase